MEWLTNFIRLFLRTRRGFPFFFTFILRIIQEHAAWHFLWGRTGKTWEIWNKKKGSNCSMWGIRDGLICLCAAGSRIDQQYRRTGRIVLNSRAMVRSYMVQPDQSLEEVRQQILGSLYASLMSSVRVPRFPSHVNVWSPSRLQYSKTSLQA